MFKFNFSRGEEDEEQDEGNSVCANDNEVEWYESSEVNIPVNTEERLSNLSGCQVNRVDYGNGLIFSCLSPADIVTQLKTENGNQFADVLQADEQHSDLLPGKYEGGLKIWECTRDLAVYFYNKVIKAQDLKMNDKTILDLGCGSGILGIMCLQNGAKVTFQDYNKEVLETMTIPNVILNITDYTERTSFYSGDWASFQNLYIKKYETTNLSQSFPKFDFILTSETIYNENNYNKLIDIFKTLLKPDGIIYVAAKSHYFGVGGTVFEFRNQLHNNNFSSSIAWETSEGISRKILEVRSTQAAVSQSK